MKKADENRKRIIETTKHLMNQQVHVTIKDIAEACYLNIAAVNYYFGSKDRLFSMVMEETVEEFKQILSITIEALPKDEPMEKVFETMLDFIYQFAIDHLGIVRRMFLEFDAQAESSNIIVDTFFLKSEFTEKILDHISASTNIQDRDILYARYMLLFSSFAIPLFIQLLQENKKTSQSVMALRDPDFRHTYIRELLRIIQ